MRLTIRWSFLYITASASLACGHSEPFGLFTDTLQTVPFSIAPATQLTYDEGMDRFATWSSEEATIWYSFQPRDRADGDVCLASMPSSGGTRTPWCDPSVAGRSQRDAFERPTPGPDGQLLYGHYTSAIGAPLVSAGALVLATTKDPLVSRTLIVLPTNVNGIGFNHIGRMEWLSSERFLMIAEDETIERHCRGCVKWDTLFVGHGVFEGTITGTGAFLRRLPGTGGASDFTLSAGRDSIYFVQYPPSTFVRVVPVAGGASEVAFTASREIYSISRGGDRFFVGQRDRVALLSRTGTSEAALFPNGHTGTSGYATVTAARDGCRVLAEYSRPSDITFQTDIYMLTAAVTGCEQ